MTRNRLGREYLTRAKVEALLELATRGADEVQAELDDLLQYGELEREDLFGDDLERHDRKQLQLERARQAGEILARRVKLTPLGVTR